MRERSERGQGTVEWVGTLAVVALLLVALVMAGVRVPGTALAGAVASRILCAAALADTCRDEPVLVAAYGTEVGELVRRHMPSIAFERGSRAMPIDFRRCRSSACSDGSERGVVDHTDDGLPVTAFVHVVDCRPRAAQDSEAAGEDCSGPRAGNLYIQYWTYYADSATFRIPYASRYLERIPHAAPGYHKDDWESVQIRIGPGGNVDERASSHHGYNYGKSDANWGSDAGIGPLRHLAEAVGLRPHNGWGPETHRLMVSGGSHAGDTMGIDFDRVTPGRRVHLVPLEPILPEVERYRFGPTPPWLKEAWDDPETEGTD